MTDKQLQVIQREKKSLLDGVATMEKVLCVELLRGCLDRKAQSEGKADCTSRFQILDANKDQLSF